MSRYESRLEVAQKADNEGGPLELVFGYGLSLEDLPEDDTELRDALAALLAVADAVHTFEGLLNDALDDALEGEEW